MYFNVCKPTEPGHYVFRSPGEEDFFKIASVKQGDWKKSQNPEELYANGVNLKNHQSGTWSEKISVVFNKTTKDFSSRNGMSRDEILKAINEVADAYAEKRTDVCEILYSIVEGGYDRKKHLGYIEYRYAKGEIRLNKQAIIEVTYDTLTTIIEYCFSINGEKTDWEVVSNEDYTDD